MVNNEKHSNITKPSHTSIELFFLLIDALNINIQMRLDVAFKVSGLDGKGLFIKCFFKYILIGSFSRTIFFKAIHCHLF